MKHEEVVSFNLVVFTSCRLSAGCRVSVFFVGCIGLYKTVVVCWLSGYGCPVLTVDCRVSLSVVVVDSWLSNVGCYLSVLPVAHFSIAGAHTSIAISI
jgi:hypothetical protein